MIATRRMPPHKTPGRATGPRRVNGALLDCRWAADLLGVSQKTLRARVARRLVPFRRFGKRIVFVRKELEDFLVTLEGCAADEALANLAVRKGEQ